MKWYVDTEDIHEIVTADDQWDAYDAIRDRDFSEFGLIVTAQRVDQTENEGLYGVRTSFLFGKRWGDPIVARAFIVRGMQLGMPDTTADDIA